MKEKIIKLTERKLRIIVIALKREGAESGSNFLKNEINGIIKKLKGEKYGKTIIF